MPDNLVPCPRAECRFQNKGDAQFCARCGERLPVPPPTPLPARIRDFFHAFEDLFRLPVAFWIIIVAFMINSMAYFGMLTLMTTYLNQDIGLADRWASPVVSVFTAFVTLFMLGFGSLAERLGVRRGLLFAITLCVVGRIAFSGVPSVTTSISIAVPIIVGALILIAAGEAIQQPLTYAGVKQYTDEKTSAMGYGLIYALMNLGIFFIGLLSPLVRVPVDQIQQAKEAGAPPPDSMLSPLADWVSSGIGGVNWLCTSINILGLLFVVVLFTRRVESYRLRVEDEQQKAADRLAASTKPWSERVGAYFAEGPFTNVRFLFFIFMLFPVQTLFAHQWLTLPNYVLRAYPQGVADRMEWIVNWINPGIIFLGVPIATALTRRVNVYTMMIIGSLVSAVPTFLLCGEPNLYLLIAYLVLFSIGEALWQPRFLQYAAELAPEGKVAQYMGLANVPWISVKMTTGIYSGFLLEKYCPREGPQDTATLWLIYGLIAITSPVGLILGRKWVMSGQQMGDAKKTDSAA